MGIESDLTMPSASVSGFSSPFRLPVVPADGECEPNGLDVSFPSIMTTPQMQQCEGSSSEPMTYGRKTRATHSFRDTIGNARRAHKASSHSRHAGDEFLLVNPGTNVVDSQMTTKCHVFRPRPRRPKPNGICRRTRDAQGLAYIPSFGPSLSEGSLSDDTMISEPRRSAFGHHAHKTTTALGDGNFKNSQWLNVQVPFTTKVSPSPLPCVDLDLTGDHTSPIQLSMKPISPDLDIFSVVTGSTIRRTEDATPPPTTYDPLWGAVLTLSSNEGSTMTPEATYY